MKMKTLLLIMLPLLSTLARAESVNDLLASMEKIQADPAALSAAIQQGADRAVLCFQCHGSDGNSTRDHIPNLASQNATYLFTQFENFANGKRKDYVMAALTRQLTPDERIAIALYFANRPVVLRADERPVAPNGRQLYMSACAACHGSSGHGNQQFSRLAGQPYAYMESTLMKFRNRDPDRAQSMMVGVVQSLSDQEIRDIASYLSNTP